MKFKLSNVWKSVQISIGAINDRIRIVKIQNSPFFLSHFKNSLDAVKNAMGHQLMGLHIKIAFSKAQSQQFRSPHLNMANKRVTNISIEILAFRCDHRTIDINSMQRIQFDRMCSRRQLRMQMFFPRINQGNVCNISFWTAVFRS